MSLRVRVLLALLAVVAAGLVVSDIATYQFLRSFLVQRVDSQVDALRIPEVQAIFGRDRHGPPTTLSTGTASYIEVRDASNTTVLTDNKDPFGQEAATAPSLPQRLSLPADCAPDSCPATVLDVAAKQAGGPDYRVHVWKLPTSDGSFYTLVIALPLGDLEETLSRLLIVEAAVSALVLAGSGAAGLYLVRLGLRPLSEIETTAGAIAAGDLSQRVRRAEPRTEVGRLGIALNSMLGQIESAFAEKDASEQRLRRFLADASHELRTPLTSIRGYAELFRRGARHRPDDLAKAMSRIEEESGRMGILVDDLLLLARLDQGRPLEREPVDLTALVEEGVDAARAVEPDRSIELSTPGPVVISGDPARLRQVVDNLLANVRTHTPSGTPAKVVLSTDGENAVLEVIDFGPGLPAEGRDRIFNRFFRADPSRSRDRGGAGLGLSIINAIVTAHGGTVSAHDTFPGGTTFRVELPVRGSEPPNSQLTHSQDLPTPQLPVMP